MTTATRITATAARKAAKKLGGSHPAVIAWRAVASGRIARINNADASHRTLGNSAVMLPSLEAAKAAMAAAALLS